MSRSNGSVLDATALIDFHWIGQWDWLRDQYGPLHVAAELLESDALCPETQETAAQHLATVTMETADELLAFAALGVSEPLLSAADRATVVIAQHREFVCLSDDGLLVRTCGARGVPVFRTLRLLSQMVETGHRTRTEVIAMARRLVDERGKWVAAQVLRAWEASLP
jgi:hypothetical protein